ncbi:MAG: hypothetical protein ACTSQG_06850 [Promethearchaeota archaeon]
MSKKPLLKKILTLLCYLTLIHGIYWVFLMFFGMYDLISGTVGMAVGQSTGFLIFIYIATTLLLLKLKDKNQNPRAYYSIMIIGLTISGLFAVPLFLTPIAITNAESEFSAAFGENWEDKIPNDIKEDYFLKTQFNLPQYFLGIPLKDCKVERDIKFYDNESITLYFDVYQPKEPNEKLPGKRSIIIKIHGGGWTVGDKGIGNMPAVNKYLAAQGYIVFDIQYGLRKNINFMNKIKFDQRDSIISPGHKLGDFTVEDQIRHIGIFEKLLVKKYADKYDANIHSVFIMGGSAGGHLTSLFGLSYNERGGKFAKYFDDLYTHNLTIKGIIPIYPAIDARLYFDYYMPDLLEDDPESNPELYNAYTPSELVDGADPPCLIFQGTSDGLAPMEQSKMLERAYEDVDGKCCRLLFPLAGHANDLLYNSNYGQVWLYYLERFLYICQEL